MTIERKLLGTTPVSGEVLPEAVSFDGADDYLSRGGNMTGNSDGKTCTFSCWVYRTSDSFGYIYGVDKQGTSDSVVIGMGNYLQLDFRDSAGTRVVDAYTSANVATPALNTWSHWLFSFDTSSASNRKVYVNDIDVTSSFTWDVFTNANIDFSPAATVQIKVGASADGSSRWKGRLAHVFLDYTYRDLSVTANRRLFIDADGKPSDTIPSSPILYLPMKDAATAGSNSGTGGDFTVNGVMHTAHRGPNQDNCSASTFDGSNDYLSRASISGLSDGKLFTFSVNTSQTSGNGQIFTGSNGKVSIKIAGNKITVRLKGSNNIALLFSTPYPANELAHGQHNSISFSCDLSDTSKRHMFINGVDITSGITFTNYSNETALLVQTPYAIGAAATALADVYTGSIGEFYLDTAYYDLATDNPFWDSDTNRPNSVRKVIEDTGVTPAIAMPLIGSDAGNNLGSGGDFTVNSGPYVGARGGSEFKDRSWERTETATSGSSVGYMYRDGTGFGVTPNNTNTCTIVTTFKYNSLPTGGLNGNGDVSSNQQQIIRIGRSTDLSDNIILFYNKNYNSFRFSSRSMSASANVINFERDNEASLVTGVWYTLMISYNSSNASTAWMYINRSGGIDMVDIMGTPTVRNENTNWNATDDIIIGGSQIGTNPAAPAEMEMGMMYMNNSYINLSQEANREKFIDPLGYPRDLTQQIEDGDVTNPLIYMKFDDFSNLGLNSGRGGNFTVNGTLKHGADYTR